jgi:hypothetical protein
MEPPRWNIITPSQYEWERRGLDFIRTGLPDHDPYQAWANFEFQTEDGAIYEVDLLVLTKQGFWLLEGKAWSGRIYGDAGTWTIAHDGKLRSEDNPVLLANRKTKALASLLKAQPAVGKVRVPWLEAFVFLSADDVQCDLTSAARNRVVLKDRPPEGCRPERKGVLAVLINRDCSACSGIDPDLCTPIDIKVAKALSRAMEQAGIRPSQKARRVGDYVLGDLDRVIQIDAPPAVSSFLQRMGRTGRRPGNRANCLFLATTDEALLRAAATLALWREGFVEPAAAPPKPFHILAQQLMALVLQERGIGQQAWFEWVADVPAFADMDRAKVADLVQHLLATQILWRDNGTLSFAPEGEAHFGKKNFLDLMSVFSSPPLFKVLSGHKELGFVHESTFYKREEGPVILVLAGRSWRTNHLDWKRRIAHVEPSDERGRSRWLGEGQFLSFRVCQAIRRILATDSTEPSWSQRATAKMEEVRKECPWASLNSTSLVQHPSGEFHWWTYGGGVANTLLSHHLVPGENAKVDNLCIHFPASLKLADVESLVGSRLGEEIRPTPDETAVENLKFFECLPRQVGGEVFLARFNDPDALTTIRNEPRKVFIQN